MSKTALIVDDSKSARVVLKRMLETYDLQVDTSESAEEALEYLDGKRPDVIFMDHLMPGMDGFEAVTAIKKNPDTAMIPIMMYTSQEGEVYVGQARALGAVGVLPKTVEPVEVSKILASLHLTDDAPASPPRAEVSAGTDVSIQDLLQDLFDQQRVILQRELRDTYSNFTQHFAQELRAVNEDEAPPGQALPTTEREPHRWLAVLLFAVVVFAAIALWQMQRIDQLDEQNVALRAQANSPAGGDLERQLSGYRGALADSQAALHEALEWGINQSAGYDWDEIPLNGRRVQLFDDLLARLMAMGFVGDIVVSVHVGNFCLVDDGSGLLTLAPPTLDASACEQIGFDPVEALGMGSRQTVNFANFVVMAEERSGGAIRFDIQSQGNTDPQVAYPESMAGIEAAGWNDIAALNNRVVVRLRPDGM